MSAPQGNLDAYIHQVGQIAVLKPEEEVELARRLRDHGDLDAARQLVLAHLRFVVHIARGYQGYGLAQGDLIQEGNVGLMKAVKRFDPEQGVRLISFAVHWIRAEMHEFILRNWKIVKVATTKAQRKLFFNLRKSKKRLGWFSNDEVNAVANDLGVTPDNVREMEMRLSSHDPSFDSPTNADEENDFTAPATYLEDSSHDPARVLESSDWQSQNLEKLSSALEGLDDRSRDILNKRWLTDDKATLHELAAQYSVSAERIRQLEKNAIGKLKKAMSH
jgi:RNA polymerase sigma-32 factor